MTFIDPKTILLAASLVSGGAIGGVSALDTNALEGVQEAMAAASEEGSTASLPEDATDDPSVESDALETEEVAVEAAEAAPAIARPGRRVRGTAGRGAEHRSARATEVLSRAGLASPGARGAEHRNEHADRVHGRSAERADRVHGRSAEHGMKR